MLRFFSLLLLTLTFAQAQPLIVTSMQPHYSLLRQLVGDRAEVVRILPVGASPHTFSPTPRDVARLAEADLVVFNGGLDEWLLELIEASGTQAPVIEVLEVLEFEPLGGLEPDEHEGEQDEAEHEEDVGEGADEQAHDHAGVNPHVWLDPRLMAQLVPHLVGALAAVDTANAEVYRANGEALIADLEALDAEVRAILAPVAGAAFVPFHDAWPYFARRYGLELVVEIEPAPGREPSPRYLAEALELIEASGAKAIFSDVQLPSRPAELVAEQAGLPLFTLDPEGGGLNAEESYQELMLANARTIAQALGE